MAIFLRKINVSDKNLELIQASIEQAIQAIQQLPLVGGNVVEFDLLSASQNSVPHGLGYAPSYWQIIDKDANSNVWRSADSDASFLYLSCSADVSVKVWFK